MKNMTLCLTAGLALAAASFVAAEAAPPQEDKKLEQSSTDVDAAAARPDGQKNVESRLKSEYKVDDARILGLRDQKLGYGEISIALALAEKLPGGITDANVATVMAQRNGPPKVGWGQIAKNQGTTVGKLLGRVKNVEAAARKQERAEARTRENAEKRERPATAQPAQRPDRPEKHEGGGNAGHGKR